MHTTGTDGAKLYRRGALFDSQLQVACKYALAADGKLRCLPMVAPEAAEGIVYYSDNQCMKPHVWLATPPVGCPLNLPKYVYKYGAPTYCPEEPKFHVFPVEGNVVPNAVNYRIHNGVCEYISVSYVGLTAFTLKAELPSSSFVEGTPGQEP
jgi:hypothetical protein